MATLVSPGVSVTVTNESFNVSSGPGTVPLIFIATAQDKLNGAGDAIAEGTTKANANKLFLATSQRELIQAFGLPDFNVVAGNAQHGNPLNEYGLLAAHSYLGASNRAYIVRADVDLAQLQPLDDAPLAPPLNGTYWLDRSAIDAGVYERVASNWVKQKVYATADVDASTKAPKNVPNEYKYALTAGFNGNTENYLWVRTTTGFAPVYNGSDGLVSGGLPGSSLPYNKGLIYSDVWPTKKPDGTDLAVGDIWIKPSAAHYPVKVYDSASGEWVSLDVPMFGDYEKARRYYSDDIAVGDMFGFYSYDNVSNYREAVVTEEDICTGQTSLFKFKGGNIVAMSNKVVPAIVTTAEETLFGIVRRKIVVGVEELDASNIHINVGDTRDGVLAKVNTALLTANITDVAASYSSDFHLVLTCPESVSSLTISANDANLFNSYTYSNWERLAYSVDKTAPTGTLTDGTLWYSAEFKVDLMKVNDAGNAWENVNTDKVHTQSSEPASASDGDIWVDTDQLDSYPVIYRRVGTSWLKIDNTDQTTPNGIIFADARPDPKYMVGSAPAGVNNNNGSNPDLDADAPMAAAYPAGMLLWNTRYSTRNVKEWKVNHTYDGHSMGGRWVSRSGNDFDGSLITGERAVRKVVVSAMSESIVNNEDIRAETVFYNLIAAPGYVELIDEMLSLNIDKKEIAFVVGDTPMSLRATGTALRDWATNKANAASNGEKGLLTSNDYLGLYYPSGLTTNVDGTEVVVPASHMALRTIAYNDQVAYQWFAPAGLQRGIVSNAVSVGYIDAEREYVPVVLSEGLCDVLYTNNINPIKLIPNRGLVIFGQKTRSAASSAMDRINVVRLVNYVRYQVDQLVRPYLFEPNDEDTRGNVKTAIDSFVSGIVTLRGIYGFLTVCDTSNNTPDRIDRNELWIDIAIQPTKAIEFIYIPIRIRNTGSTL